MSRHEMDLDFISEVALARLCFSLTALCKIICLSQERL